MRTYFTPEEIRNLTFEDMMNLTKAPPPTPFFSSSDTTCAHSLYYSWNGWLIERADFPPNASEMVEKCRDLWGKDGFVLINAIFEPNHIQLLFKVEPEIAPVLFMKKVKGRLDHAFRKESTPVHFSELNGFRALGANTDVVVQEYIKKQVRKEGFVNERYQQYLEQFIFDDLLVDLSEPYHSHSGRYWYNIHLVIVLGDRSYPITQEEVFEVINSYLPRISDKKRCLLAKFAIMPDHIHIALRGNIEMSPYDIGLSFMNNLSHVLRRGLVWKREFYVGTFSRYALTQIGLAVAPVKKTSFWRHKATGDETGM